MVPSSFSCCRHDEKRYFEVREPGDFALGEIADKGRPLIGRETSAASVLRVLRARFGSGSSNSSLSIVWLLVLGGLSGLFAAADWVAAFVKKPDKVCCFFLCVLVMVRDKASGRRKMSELYLSLHRENPLYAETRLIGLALINA
jgi:hypothetical protein